MTSTDCVTISDDSYCKSFLLGLMDMQEQSELTDVILRVQDVTVACHRLVLSAATPYFRSMFNSNLKERTSSEVELKDLEASTIPHLVKYMYTAEIKLTVDNVQGLAQACDLLQLSQLKDHCEAFMVSYVTPANCLGFHRFASLYSLKQLAQTALKCMQENFHEVVSSRSELVTLSEEELVTYISDDQLNVPNENIVVEAVLEWVRADLEARTGAVRHVAEHLRFPFCTKAYLCHQVIPEPLFSVCQGLLQEATNHHLIRGQLQTMFHHLPRVNFDADHQLVLLGGLTESCSVNIKVWMLNHEQESWHELCALPKSLLHYSVCVSPEGIMVTGGCCEQITAECWLYCTNSKMWEALPPMITARWLHQAAYHDGHVFVLGGDSLEDTTLASVERLNLRRHCWEQAPPMLLQLRHPLVVSFHSKLLIFSGEGPDNTPSCRTQEFDPVWKRWQYKADMPMECDSGAAVCLGDRAYVVGGFSKSCMSYEPLTDTWSVLTRPCQSHGNAPAVVWRGKIVVGGGKNEDHAIEDSAIEEFDPKKDEWSVWSQPMPEDLWCHFLLDTDFL